MTSRSELTAIDAPSLFRCERHAGSLTLTEPACARLWQRGKAAGPGEAAYPCRGCPIGAQHAGEAPTASQTPMTEVCVRCGSLGRRMIRSRGVCVSCYNREREIAIGRDRRGRAPQRPARVPVLEIAVDGVLTVRQAAGRVELVLWVLRQRPDARISRWAPRAETTALAAQDEPVARQLVCGDPIQAAFFPGMPMRTRATGRRITT